jgi:hypothetical protein
VLLLFVDEQVLTYHVSGNRFCARVGRQHKSNQIYFVVDMRRTELLLLLVVAVMVVVVLLLLVVVLVFLLLPSPLICPFSHSLSFFFFFSFIFSSPSLSAGGEVSQKCFDPDCRGFRSWPVSIPHHRLRSEPSEPRCQYFDTRCFIICFL